jgi:trk system potassium uptake protein TrkH
MFIISFLKIASILLSIVGILFAIPLGFAFYYGESSVYLSFIIPMAASFLLVAAVNFPTRKFKITLNTRQTFLTVALSWIVISFMGAIPMYASGSIPRFVDALFESVSGFSTTGSTILSEIESLPKSINMLRCLTHWIGGMGIVTLTVALLPLLGVGGFQLIKAETTGPEKGKVTARITTTAKILWLIYFGFTAAETIALKLAGMTFTDALSHAFATLGTGGFSTRNASIGSYNSVAIDVIIMIFMFLAGINFSLYFYIFTRKLSDITSNSEFKAYLVIVAALIVAVSISLRKVYGSFGDTLRYSSFQVVSLMTTTGFSTADFMKWPAATQFLLFVTFFIGGCSGSTSGGVKVIRWLVLGKQVQNETRKMLHPHGVFAIRLNGRPGRKDIVFNVAAFMVVYFALVLITTFVGCLGNLDVWSSFTGALSMVGNIGPGYGLLGPAENFGFLPDFVKYWYSFAMLAGRLELYTMIIYFLPVYWEK